jgi:hypothetical protein
MKKQAEVVAPVDNQGPNLQSLRAKEKADKKARLALNALNERIAKREALKK